MPRLALLLPRKSSGLPGVLGGAPPNAPIKPAVLLPGLFISVIGLDLPLGTVGGGNCLECEGDTGAAVLIALPRPGEV